MFSLLVMADTKSRPYTVSESDFLKSGKTKYHLASLQSKVLLTVYVMALVILMVTRSNKIISFSLPSIACYFSWKKNSLLILLIGILLYYLFPMKVILLHNSLII